MVDFPLPCLITGGYCGCLYSVFWGGAIGYHHVMMCNDLILFFGPLAMDNSSFRWPFSSGISQLINIIPYT